MSRALRRRECLADCFLSFPTFVVFLAFAQAGTQQNGYCAVRTQVNPDEATGRYRSAFSLNSRSPLRKLTQDAAQFVTALRTPIAKFKGAYKDTYPEELLAHVLKATRERLEGQGLDIQGGGVQDIAVGTVLMELGGAKSGRLASLHAGYVLRFTASHRRRGSAS